MRPRFANPMRAWLYVIVGVAALLRFYPIWFGLPFAHARPDETTALGLASHIRGGDLNPHFFHWGSLTLYVFALVHGLTAAVRRVLGLDPALSFTEMVVSARATVALAGTLTVVVVYAAGRRMGGAVTALLAALFLAVAILHVRESHFAMTDALMTLLLTASLALLLEATERTVSGRDGCARWFLAAGLAGGLAAATKYSAAAVLTAMGAAQVLLLARDRSRILSLGAWLPSAAFVLAFTAGFVTGTPYSILDFTQFESDVRFDITHLSGGHGINLGRGWWYHLTYSLPYGLGIPTFAAAIAGIPFTIYRYPRHAFVLWTFAAAFYTSIGSGQTVFFRYILPLLPVLCLSAAVFVVEVASRIAARAHIPPAAATIGLALLVAGPAFVNSLWFDILMSRTDSRVLAAEWLTPRLNAGDTLYDNGGSYAELNLTPAAIHRWQYDAALGRFVNAGDRTPDWLVLQESPLNPLPVLLVDLARTRYDLVLTVTASAPKARSAVYDRQDAFFMPISGFGFIERPGPTIRIYRRRDGSSPLPAGTASPDTRR
jgi:4-amino-4-deoxy-L-arabinose transferase-like glycosyltransferase